ncbi:MAG: TAT-variant-translocated molybdopterin oxidoreductase [Pirellulaceae bacterium]
MNSANDLPRYDLEAIRRRAAEHGGRRYWRSLDELARTPEFEQLVEREFPSQLAVWNDPVGRRKFLKLMAASLALGGAVGCTRPPPETIVPYVKSPEEIVPGRPLFYATAIAHGGYALGLLVESHEGRPTKIEGNPQHPASLGATDAFAQASILSLYDPDRSQTVIHRGIIETWDRFLTTLAARMEKLRARGGAGLRILTLTASSPTLAGQLDRLLAELPEARWHQHEPADLDNVHAGTRLAFGREADAQYHFDKAACVVSLDADFLLGWPGSVRYARDWIAGRRVSGGQSSMSRLYVVESTPTITGAMADHRLPLLPSQIEAVARALAQRVGVAIAEPAQEPAGVPSNWLEKLAEELQAKRGSGLVLAGPGQPPAVHALAHAMNGALDNIGQTVNFVEPVHARPPDQDRSLAALTGEMRRGEVETLVILGGNPVYSSAGELEFAGALAKVPFRVHLSEYYDETSFLCDWHIPATHYLEAWSDARSLDGTASIVQPLIAPLYDGKSAHELVAALQGSAGRTPYEIVQERWRQVLGEDDFGTRWRQAVHDGVIAGTESTLVEVALDFTDAPTLVAETVAGAAAAGEALELDFRPDPTLWDGDSANNGWLQELPKPLTKITWDNVALVSPALADRRGWTNGEIVQITAGRRRIDAPVWIMPGQPDGCVSLTFGYGRTRSGRIGSGVGYSAYAIRPAQGAWYRTATVRATGRQQQIATTQQHHNLDNLEERDIVRVTTRARFDEDSHHLDQAGKHGGDALPSLYPEYEYPANSWGMTIDQTACIGCNACVVACQAENNIPIVGREQVLVGREMHWLRIDSYFLGEPDNPDMYFQPMLCQHCEKAPCEVVCPVMATVHDSEGTSNMIYNRCVGTRYCSNNCPYKVRRFNYLQYADETTASLKLLRNPDVSVRSRGVMEKCSYCIQRISAGRIAAKLENRPIRDGEVVTACQQACPTRAIVFGNLNDPLAEVAAIKQSPLNYGVLAELGTQPRTTYLARVVNPHPALPAPRAVQSQSLEAPSIEMPHP